MKKRNHHIISQLEMHQGRKATSAGFSFENSGKSPNFLCTYFTAGDFCFLEVGPVDDKSCQGDLIAISQRDHLTSFKKGMENHISKHVHATIKVSAIYYQD